MAVRLWRARESWHMQRDPAVVTVLGDPVSLDEYWSQRGCETPRSKYRRCGSWR
jgi:hypothetical protein